MKTLVLDAMGVIYAARDDIVELLCPFVHEQRGIKDDRRIEELYTLASLGKLSAEEFWKQVQVDSAAEDEYLLRHRLSAGLLSFLPIARHLVDAIWCLSNDVSQWSRKLREHFQLDRFVDGYVISGDVGARKPDAAIYRTLLAKTGIKPEEIVFVDDRPRNLDAAAELGFQTILFAPRQTAADIFL